MNSTAVKTCTTTACSYNNHGCTALAITIAGKKQTATCGTFIKLDARRPVASTSGQVGACQQIECKHNADLMCTADGIGITADAACASFEIA
ncbi:MAG: DUF1540 domain-containing protein [Propionibacteriaceae bacterium]